MTVVHYVTSNFLVIQVSCDGSAAIYIGCLPSKDLEGSSCQLYLYIYLSILLTWASKALIQFSKLKPFIKSKFVIQALFRCLNKVKKNQTLSW
jgi:hypothetical protein